MIKFLEFIGKLVASGRFSVADLAYNQLVLQILLWFGFVIMLIAVIGILIELSKVRQILQKMCNEEITKKDWFICYIITFSDKFRRDRRNPVSFFGYLKNRSAYMELSFIIDISLRMLMAKILSPWPIGRFK